jgi:hypothetical protein
VLRSRTALRRLLWDPSELGLARAYSCAYFREDPATDAGAADGSYGITEAQRDSWS